MAKSKETYNKKEKEKKRLKEKQDKKQRMEERKANKKDGHSLEGMIAYLDENGNLTDTPPDPSRRKTIQLESIEIGVPKRPAESEDATRTGVVTFFNPSKGFGFINDHSSNERVFFHVKDVQQPIAESDKVSFLIERGPRGLSALNVDKL